MNTVVKGAAAGTGQTRSPLVLEVLHEWNADRVPILGAALAFYTVLSLAPLIIIALRISAFFFSDDSVRQELERQVSIQMGEAGEAAVKGVLEKSTSESTTGSLATVLGTIMLFVGGAGVFGHLQESLNVIWKVVPKPGRGIMQWLRDRALSIAMVVGTAALLLGSLIVSAVLSYLGSDSVTLPGRFPLLFQTVNAVASLMVFAFLFSLIFKVLPDAVIDWSDVWPGGLLTAVLFAVGKVAIGAYLSRSALASSYGAAGSLVVLLVWVYYSAQIIFLGAEFTHVYARRNGKQLIATENAITRAQHFEHHREQNRF